MERAGHPLFSDSFRSFLIFVPEALAQPKKKTVAPNSTVATTAVECKAMMMAMMTMTMMVMALLIVDIVMGMMMMMMITITPPK